MVPIMAHAQFFLNDSCTYIKIHQVTFKITKKKVYIFTYILYMQLYFNSIGIA